MLALSKSMIRFVFVSMLVWRTVFVCSQLATTHYLLTNKIIHVYSSHMTYLMSHVTSLNNTCGWSYKLTHSGLEQTCYKPICSQTLSLVWNACFLQEMLVIKKLHSSDRSFMNKSDCSVAIMFPIYAIWFHFAYHS